MSKKKRDNKEFLPLIPVAFVILIVVGVLVIRNCDFDDPDSEAPDTGQTTTVSNDDDFELPPIEEDPDISARQPPADVQISCDEVAVYDGPFVESGKDEPVEDVASILITNKSDKYLDYVKLTYEIDGHEAVFIASGLHSGKSVWVLEANGLKITDQSKFVYVKALTSYKDHVVRDPKELDMKFADGMMKIKNISDEPLENVIVYYKTVNEDGKFLGGKTYSVSFGAVEPGQSVEKVAGHFDVEWTQIVRVDLIKADD